MTAPEPVRDADTLATIIPFRPRRSAMALHPSAGSPGPDPDVAADDPCAVLHPVPVQLSFLETGPKP
jgi:hypothetical protein